MNDSEIAASTIEIVAQLDVVTAAVPVPPAPNVRAGCEPDGEAGWVLPIAPGEWWLGMPSSGVSLHTSSCAREPTEWTIRGSITANAAGWYSVYGAETVSWRSQCDDPMSEFACQTVGREIVRGRYGEGDAIYLDAGERVYVLLRANAPMLVYGADGGSPHLHEVLAVADGRIKRVFLRGSDDDGNTGRVVVQPVADGEPVGAPQVFGWPSLQGKRQFETVLSVDWPAGTSAVQVHVIDDSGNSATLEGPVRQRQALGQDAACHPTRIDTRCAEGLYCADEGRCGADPGPNILSAEARVDGTRMVVKARIVDLAREISGREVSWYSAADERLGRAEMTHDDQSPIENATAWVEAPSVVDAARVEIRLSGQEAGPALDTMDIEPTPFPERQVGEACDYWRTSNVCAPDKTCMWRDGESVCVPSEPLEITYAAMVEPHPISSTVFIVGRHPQGRQFSRIEVAWLDENGEVVDEVETRPSRQPTDSEPRRLSSRHPNVPAEVTAFRARIVDDVGRATRWLEGRRRPPALVGLGEACDEDGFDRCSTGRCADICVDADPVEFGTTRAARAGENLVVEIEYRDPLDRPVGYVFELLDANDEVVPYIGREMFSADDLPRALAGGYRATIRLRADPAVVALRVRIRTAGGGRSEPVVVRVEPATERALGERCDPGAILDTCVVGTCVDRPPPHLPQCHRTAECFGDWAVRDFVRQANGAFVGEGNLSLPPRIRFIRRPEPRSEFGRGHVYRFTPPENARYRLRVETRAGVQVHLRVRRSCADAASELGNTDMSEALDLDLERDAEVFVFVDAPTLPGPYHLIVSAIADP